MTQPIAVLPTKLSPADHDYPALLAESLQHLGWNVVILPAAHLRNRARLYERFQLLLQRTGAQAIFSINFAGSLAKVSLQTGVPYIAWNEVYPLSFDTPALPAANDVWCFESSKSMTAWWRGKRINAEFFPLGFDERVFSPRGGAPQWEVSFVGNGLAHFETTFDAVLDKLRATVASSPSLAQRASSSALALHVLERVHQTSFAEFEAVDGCDLERLVARIAAEFPCALETQQELRHVILRLPTTRVALHGLLARRQRIETLGRVAALGRLQVFGRDWEQTPIAPRAAAPQPFDETATVFRCSRMSLHIQRFYAHNINDRVVNVPAAGGFLLARNAEAIEEVFEPGREIAVYDDLADLEDKTRFYLQHDAERRRIAEAGCRRAHARYGFRTRLAELLRRVGLPRSEERRSFIPPAKAAAVTR